MYNVDEGLYSSAQIFSGVACFQGYYFGYGLDIWAQDRALRAIFLEMYFSNILPKYEGILIKHVRKLCRQGLLYYIYPILFVVPKLPIIFLLA